jgi:hypothetical protein
VRSAGNLIAGGLLDCSQKRYGNRFWHDGRKTVQQPEWNVGRRGLYIKTNVLRQIGFCNKVVPRKSRGGMAGSDQ